MTRARSLSRSPAQKEGLMGLLHEQYSPAGDRGDRGAWGAAGGSEDGMERDEASPPAKKTRTSSRASAENPAASPGARGEEIRGVPVQTNTSKAATLLRKRLVGGTQAVALLEPLRAEEDEDLTEMRTRLVETLNSTVQKAYNNSCILQGARGTGKSNTLAQALAKVKEDEDHSVVVVRLSGIMHSDEKVAMKEVARQLCDDAASRMKEGRTVEYNHRSSLDNNLEFLKSLLQQEARAHRAVVFVLEEFDLFCPQKSRQTVLYTLLDAMHSTQVQSCVIGVSCRTDAVELLEKRVRSRFSHRHLNFKKVPTDQAFRELELLLSLPNDFADKGFMRRFNKGVEAALANKDAQAKIKALLFRTTSHRQLCRIALAAVCRMQRSELCLRPAHFIKACESLLEDPVVATLKGVSVVELEILVVMARLEVQGSEEYNFEMVFAEYDQLASASSLGDHAERNTRLDTLRAFESLQASELVRVCKGSGGLKEYVTVRMAVSKGELEEAMRAHPHCPSRLPTWLNTHGPIS